jgi:hypothetical protein
MAGKQLETGWAGVRGAIPADLSAIIDKTPFFRAAFIVEARGAADSLSLFFNQKRVTVLNYL